ncbi:MAG: hypothetical protein KF794_11550 [Xanthobacteraceae bacterium]|nr:hypothetical protein [Xanthobacteraceae bacterium]QYK44404.1 MAG: hypothetical protein KF794_11550 [Xanthobacteraceae bacterium]
MKLTPRLSTDALFLLLLAAVFALAHFSYRPLDNRPVRFERTNAVNVAEDPSIGIRVQDTGLRQYGPRDQ